MPRCTRVRPAPSCAGRSAHSWHRDSALFSFSHGTTSYRSTACPTAFRRAPGASTVASSALAPGGVSSGVETGPPPCGAASHVVSKPSPKGVTERGRQPADAPRAERPALDPPAIVLRPLRAGAGRIHGIRGGRGSRTRETRPSRRPLASAPLEETRGVGLVVGEEQLPGEPSHCRKRSPSVGCRASITRGVARTPREAARPRSLFGSVCPRVCETTGSAGARSVAASGPRLVARRCAPAVLLRSLGELQQHVEAAVFVEGARIQYLYGSVRLRFGVSRGSASRTDMRLRILVEVPHLGVGRRGVEVEVVLLHVLAVIALGVREPEGPLLEDRIRAVPHASARQSCCSSSQMPASPSSPHR